MNEVKKPNDIFVATLSAPNATVKDLLLNNINSSNTSFLTPEEYKDTPLVKKAFFNKLTNTFDDNAFRNAYYLAYKKYKDLTDAEADKRLEDFIEYSPSDRFRPLGANTLNTSTKFENLRNPLQQAYSIEGVNMVSDPQITLKEAAQSNFIYDPEKGQFTQYTPESLPFYKKFLGETLIYAKYDSDGTHIDPVTGQEVAHHKGEWKTDKDGNYYTEYLGNRELGQNEVVSVLDILTDEGSAMNKVDFFDSDGFDKSAFGIAAKTAVTIAPYLIPWGIGGGFAKAITLFNFMSVMPTFYKALESLITDEELPSNRAMTRMENWFRKFEYSKSDAGKQGFFTLEGLGEMVADTLGQLYQQKTAAGMAKYFMKDAPKIENYGQDIVKYGKDWEEWAKKQNKLRSALNLGYMGLISTSDVYNDALNAGYDKTTAGIAALTSAGALFGIMQFNETANGIGNWFLDKSVGYNNEVYRGATRMAAKEVMNTFKEASDALVARNKTGFTNSIKTFKNKFLNTLDDIFVVRSESVWKNAIVEGAEEVSEEVVQDAIKGIIDVMSSLGLTPKQGSFGGWDNVFSKEGASRYLQTLFGGAFGGAIFDFHRTYVEPKLEGKHVERLKYDLTQAILDGRIDEVKEELKNVKKFYNEHLSTSLGKDEDGHEMFATADGRQMSQADFVYNEALKFIEAQNTIVSKEKITGKYNPYTRNAVSQTLQLLEKHKVFDNLWKTPFTTLVNQVTSVQQELNTLEQNNDKEANTQAIKEKREELKNLRDQLVHWMDGDRFLEYTKEGLVLTTPSLINGLFKLSFENFAFNLKNIRDVNTYKEQHPEEYEDLLKLYQDYTSELSPEKLKIQLETAVKLLDAVNPRIAKHIISFANNEHNKVWMRSYEEDRKFMAENPDLGEVAGQGSSEGIVNYINNNPKYWNLSQRLRYDLASEMEKADLLDLSEFTKEEQPIVKELINSMAAISRVTVWDKNNLTTLMDIVKDMLTQKDESNVYIKKLLEMNTDDNGITTFPINKNIVSKVDTNFKEGLVMNLKIKTALDLIDENDTFIDEQLFEMLQTAINEELDEKYKTVIDNLFDTPVTLADANFPLETALSMLSESGSLDFDGNILSGLEIASGIDRLNVENNIDKVEQLSKIIKNFTSSYSEEGLYTQSSEGIMIVELNALADRLSEIVNVIKNKSIIPTELLDKWDKIKQKSTARNPLLSAISDVMRTLGDNNLDVITWLYSKARGLSTQGLTYEISDIDKHIIEDMINAIDFILTSASCIQTETGKLMMDEIGLTYAYSYNLLVREHSKLYGKKEEDIDRLYPVRDTTDLVPLADVLSDMRELLSIMIDIKAQAENRVFEEDEKRRKKFTSSCVEFFNGKRKLEIKSGDNVVMSIPLGKEYTFDPETPDDEKELAVLQNFTEIYNTIQQGIKEGKFTLDDVTTALLAAFPDVNLTERADISDMFKKEGDREFVDDRLMMTYLTLNLAISPKELELRFLIGFEGSGLLPRFDQELAVKYAVAHTLNQKFFDSLLSKLPNGDNIKLPGILFITGGAGTGKSTLSLIVAKALKNYNNNQAPKVILAAPTENKLNDLKKVVTENNGTSLYSDLFGDYSQKEKDFVNSLNTLLATIKENKSLQFTVDAIGIKFEFSINITSLGELQNISLLNREDVKRAFEDPKVSDNFNLYKDSVILIDESTHLSPYTLYLHSILSEVLNIKFIYLGDDVQSGFNSMKGNIEFRTNISQYYTMRTLGLVGTLRGMNSGKTANQTYLHDVANWYSRDYDFSTQSVEILNFYKQYKLKYTGLKGDLVTNNQDIFKQKLKELADNKGDKTIVYITEGDTTSINNLKTFLAEAGLPTDDDLFKTPKTVQGAEADFSVVFNLQTIPVENGLLKNGDTDSSRIYTVATRSKLYSLIFEDTPNGLFTTYQIESQEDKTIVDTNNGTTELQAKKAKENEEKCKKIISKLQDGVKLGSPAPVLDSDNDDPDLNPPSPDPTPTGDNKVQGNGQSKTSTTANMQNIVDSESIESKEDYTKAVKDLAKSKDISENDAATILNKLNTSLRNTFGKDSITIYSYYQRIGVPLKFLTSNINKKFTKKNLLEALLKEYSKTSASPELKSMYMKMDFFAYLTASLITEEKTLSLFLNDFIRFRNNLLYGDSKLQTGLLIYSYNSDLDYAYLKPNDKGSNTDTNVTAVAIKNINGNTYYFTIGLIGYNKNNLVGNTYSENLTKVKKAYLASNKDVGLWSIKYKDIDNDNKKSFIQLRYGKIQDNTIKEEVINETGQYYLARWLNGWVPVTGIKDFPVESDGVVTNGLDLNSRELHRITLAELKALGYEVSGIISKEELSKRNELNKTRFTDYNGNYTHWPEDFYAIIKPIAQSNEEGSTYPIKIAHIDRVTKNPPSKDLATKGNSSNISSFGIKQCLSIIAELNKNKGCTRPLFNTGSFRKNYSAFQKAVKAWYEENKDKIEDIYKKDVENFINRTQGNQNISVNVVTTDILKSIFKDADTKLVGFLFGKFLKTLDITDNEAVIGRVFESPTFFAGITGFEPITINTGNAVGGGITVTSESENQENLPILPQPASPVSPIQGTSSNLETLLKPLWDKLKGGETLDIQEDIQDNYDDLIKVLGLNNDVLSAKIREELTNYINNYKSFDKFMEAANNKKLTITEVKESNNSITGDQGDKNKLLDNAIDNLFCS